ncbi:MAG TPA: hypothetical protein VLH75_07640 [Longimicrobiales bacterium]|nr:hypothetical protein [Longimicrobiales bacterium]
MAIDFLRGLRWYAAVAVVFVIMFALWTLMGGAPGYVIQIDYTWTGDMMVGTDVVVDGVAVGTLGPYHGRPVRGFEVEKGTHVVTLRGGPCETRPDTVVVGPPRTVVLMADLEERFTGCIVFFR